MTGHAVSGSNERVSLESSRPDPFYSPSRGRLVPNIRLVSSRARLPIKLRPVPILGHSIAPTLEYSGSARGAKGAKGAKGAEGARTSRHSRDHASCVMSPQPARAHALREWTSQAGANALVVAPSPILLVLPSIHEIWHMSINASPIDAYASVSVVDCLKLRTSHSTSAPPIPAGPRRIESSVMMALLIEWQICSARRGL